MLLKLSSAPSVIEEDIIHTIERFVILMYDRTSTCHDIDKARRKIFAKKNNVKHIPSTRAALEQHVKRATYQGGYVWGQLLLASPPLPLPTSWGWIKTTEHLYCITILNHSSLVLAIFATILECVIAKYLVVFPNFTPLSLNVHRHVVNYHNLRKV